MSDKTGSFALLCNQDGIILSVLSNNLGPGETFLPGLQFLHFNNLKDVPRSLSFLHEINMHGVAYDWLMDIQLDQETRTLHFTGGKAGEQLMIIGAQDANQAKAMLEEMMLINHEQTGALRLASQKNVQNNMFLDEMSRLNNELVSAQRELVKKNAELLASNALLEQAERSLRENNQLLAQSNRDLTDFAYVASHDLQEPLRKVLMFSERLEQKTQGLLDETGKDYLYRMRDATQRMQTLIQELLTISRISTQPQNITSVDLAEITSSVIADMEAVLEKNNGQVSVAWLPTVQADATQMRQLMQNLIGNALKFHVADRPPRVNISCERTDENVYRIFVADNGIGFDMQQLERIFKPFQRLVSRAAYEGSGMGLAICKRIVERHNGEITASSVAGEGSCFMVALPKSPNTRENLPNVR